MMDFSDFLRIERARLNLSQAKIAERLSELGQETSAARVGHWETGRNKPPLDDPNFRRALAITLNLDVNEMMSRLGFVQTDDQRSREARRAADIVDRLPSEAKSLALEYLDMLDRRFVKSS